MLGLSVNGDLNFCYISEITQLQESKIHESINEELRELRKNLEKERMVKVQVCIL